MSTNAIFIAIVIASILMTLSVILTNRKKSTPDGQTLQAIKDELSAAKAQVAAKDDEMNRLHETIATLNKDKNDLSLELGETRSKVTAKEEEMKQRLDSMKDWYNKMELEFSKVAARLLEEKQGGLDKKNEEVVKPLKDALSAMQEEVRNTQQKYAVELQSLKDVSLQLSKETNHLSTVFSGGNGRQGKWGESELKRVLEISGLEEGQAGFITQSSADNEDNGKDRPDCIISLPGDKCIIIDAKTNLTAFERSFNVATEAEREQCLKEHAAALKHQIACLAGKHYHDNAEYNTPGFVIMFVPVEPALAAAQKYSSDDLFQYAAKSNIVIATPWNLISILMLIRNLWKIEWQNKNVQDIANQATLLYEKAYQALESVHGVEKNLNEAQDSCQTLIRQLGETKGGLIQQARKLEILGVKPKSTKGGEKRIENTKLYEKHFKGILDTEEADPTR